MPRFELQGHRGARGLKPENTFPSFETALDAEVDSIETDVHLTSDGALVLYHDPQLSERVCRSLSEEARQPLEDHPLLSSLSLGQLRGYSAEINPDPKTFPSQNAQVTPLAGLYAQTHNLHPFSIPLLSDLFAFTSAYAGEMGERSGKTAEQRAQALRVRYDLELKRVPYFPEVIGDQFDGRSPALLERTVLDVVLAAGVSRRTRIRSFDHRSVLAFGQLAPNISAGIILKENAPVAPEELLRSAQADTYCPHFWFLEESLVHRVHAAGFRVVPYTVNHPRDWQKLIEWGVDGITTDYPDQLAAFLGESSEGP